MSKKKSSPRKKPARKTSSRRELPRIPAPEPWASAEALERYVYVLLPSYFSGNATEDVLFHARVGGTEIEVRPETAAHFFTDHANRPFITYDATAFHHACLNVLRENQSPVWQLSHDYRLWDVGFLARRIEYAKNGYAKKIEGIGGYASLIDKYNDNDSCSFDKLQSVFVRQIEYAVLELPLFITYWGMGCIVEDVRQNGFDFPSPLTSEEYGELAYAERYYRYYRSEDDIVDVTFIRRGSQEIEVQDIPDEESDWPNADPDTSDWPSPQEMDCSDSCVAAIPAFRRRDLILTGRTGPLGIGLDLQAAIAASALNSQACTVQLDSETMQALDRRYKELSLRLKTSSLSTGFRWNEESATVQMDENGYITYEKNKLPARLNEIWRNNQAFVSAEMTPPYYAKARISTSFDDWIKYRHLDSALEDWISIETIAMQLRLSRRNQSPSYSHFPELHSGFAEGMAVLGSHVSVTDSSPSRLSLRLDNLPVIAFACTMLSEYLPFKPVPSEMPSVMRTSYFVGVFEGIQRDLGNTSIKPKAIPSPEFVDLANRFRELDDKKRLLREVVEAFVWYENVDSVKGRLGRLGLALTDRQIDVIFWLTIKHLFKPLVPTWCEIHFFQIPGAGRPDPQPRSRSRAETSPFSFSGVLTNCTLNHFGTKSEYPSNNLGFCEKLAGHGWTIVNKLTEENYSCFLPRDNPGGEFEDLLNAMRHTNKDNFLQELLLSNSISCAGRLGLPIRYYEFFRTDCRQLVDDMRTAICYVIVENGWTIDSLTETEVTFEIRNADTELAEPVNLVRQALCHLLGEAFSAGFATNNFEKLLSELVL